MNRLTLHARTALYLANQAALKLRHTEMRTEHLLLGLTEEGEGVGANVLKNLNIDFHTVMDAILEKIGFGPPESLAIKAYLLPQTPLVASVLERAGRESRSLNHNYIGTEHILLGLAGQGDGVAVQVLHNAGAFPSNIREEVLNLTGHANQAEGPMPGVILPSGNAIPKGCTVVLNLESAAHLEAAGKMLLELAERIAKENKE